MEIQSVCCEKFKTDNFNNDPKEQLPSVLKEAIAAIIKNEGYLKHDLKSKQITTNGGNYLAFLYEIDIKGEKKDGNKENNLFIKYVVPLNGNFNEFLTTADAYLRESYVYKEMSKIFTKLQEKAGVPIEERYKMVRGYGESSSEAIILDNAAKKGFKCCDRLDVVPLKFVELSLQQLAKFHGLGFAIKKFMPEYFEQEIKKMSYPLTFNEHYAKFASSVSKTAIKNLKEDLKEKAVKMAVNSPKYFEQYTFDKSAVPTICHGDFRANNILMREEEGEIVEVIPVDYQLVYYGCPANDLFYFIYGCTDREFRTKNMENLIELYYENLNEFLKYFNIDVADVCPRSKFNQALEERPYYASVVALNVYPVIFAPEDNVPDLSAESPMDSIELEPKIVRRIEEILEDVDVEDD